MFSTRSIKDVLAQHTKDKEVELVVDDDGDSDDDEAEALLRKHSRKQSSSAHSRNFSCEDTPVVEAEAFLDGLRKKLAALLINFATQNYYSDDATFREKDAGGGHARRLSCGPFAKTDGQFLTHVPEDSLFLINTHLEEGRRCFEPDRFPEVVEACAAAVTEVQEFHLDKLHTSKELEHQMLCALVNDSVRFEEKLTFDSILREWHAEQGTQEG
jgi:hypothetical protein